VFSRPFIALAFSRARSNCCDLPESGLARGARECDLLCPGGIIPSKVAHATASATGHAHGRSVFQARKNEPWKPSGMGSGTSSLRRGARRRRSPRVRTCARRIHDRPHERRLGSARTLDARSERHAIPLPVMLAVAQLRKLEAALHQHLRRRRVAAGPHRPARDRWRQLGDSRGPPAIPCAAVRRSPDPDGAVDGTRPAC
jgi:hypothetical protein